MACRLTALLSMLLIVACIIASSQLLIIDVVKAKIITYIRNVNEYRVLDEYTIKSIPADTRYPLHLGYATITQGKYRYTFGDLISYAIKSVYDDWFLERIERVREWVRKSVTDPRLKDAYLTVYTSFISSQFHKLLNHLLKLFVRGEFEGGLAGFEKYYKAWILNLTMTHCSTESWVIEPAAEDIAKIIASYFEVFGRFLIYLYDLYKEISMYRHEAGEEAKVALFSGWDFRVYVDYDGNLYVWEEDIDMYVKISIRKVYIACEETVFAIIDLGGSIKVDTTAIKEYLLERYRNALTSLTIFMIADNGKLYYLREIRSDTPFAHLIELWPDTIPIDFWPLECYISAFDRVVRDIEDYLEEKGCGITVPRPSIVLPGDIDDIYASLRGLKRSIFFIGYLLTCASQSWGTRNLCSPDDVLLPRELVVVRGLIHRNAEKLMLIPIANASIALEVGDVSEVTGFWLVAYPKDPDWIEIRYEPFDIIVTSITVDDMTVDSYKIITIPADEWYSKHREGRATTTATAIIVIPVIATTIMTTSPSPTATTKVIPTITTSPSLITTTTPSITPTTTFPPGPSPPSTRTLPTPTATFSSSPITTTTPISKVTITKTIQIPKTTTKIITITRTIQPHTVTKTITIPITTIHTVMKTIVYTITKTVQPHQSLRIKTVVVYETTKSATSIRNTSIPSLVGILQRRTSPAAFTQITSSIPLPVPLLPSSPSLLTYLSIGVGFIVSVVIISIIKRRRVKVVTVEEVLVEE